MEASAFIKQEDGVESAKICRWCLTAGDALEALTPDGSGQYKVQRIFDFTDLQIELSPGVPSYLCTTCETRLEKMDTFRWRCNEKNDLVDKFIKQQNTAKNESQITHDHLDRSTGQTVGTELSIKTEVSSPDAATDLHLKQKCYTVHEANRTYECCGKIPDDLFEAHENPIAIKSEREDVDEQHQLQTTNDGLRQDKLKNHRKSKKHHCPHCYASFPALSKLKNHIRRHTGERPYQCKVCDKNFFSSRALENHSIIHNKDQHHQCPHCSSMFAQTSGLKNHIRTHTGEKPYQCKVCDKAFHSSNNLAQHSKIHNRDEHHQCPHCTAKFSRLPVLKDHIRIHTGEKPFVCKICNQGFPSSTALGHHLKIHKDDQHQCPHCSSMFAQISGLRSHIRTHTGERVFQCKVCGKVYRSSTYLAIHSKIHNKGETTIRSYQCKICDKAFYTKYTLAQHSKIHNKDQQHQCPHCLSMFAQTSGLKNHIRTHTGEKPYQCKVCDKAFHSSSNRAKHLKIHKKGKTN